MAHSAARGARRLLIDTDAGADDAIALLLALSSQQCRVDHIFCVHGNVGVDQAARNVRYLQKFVPSSQSQPKIYKGCHEPILNYKVPKVWEGHGEHGLGSRHVTEDDLVDSLPVESEHAVEALIRVVRENPSDHFDMLCIGPLTNVAMAVKLYPELIGKLGSVWIMGGQTGKGNYTQLAEYNFRADPEAAKIVMDARPGHSKIHVCPWNTVTKRTIPFSDLRCWNTEDLNTMTKLFRDSQHPMYKISQDKSNDVYTEEEDGWACPDGLTLCCLMHPELCEFEEREITVETQGDIGRGAMAMDPWAKANARRARIVTSAVPFEKYKALLNDLCGGGLFEKYEKQEMKNAGFLQAR